MYGAILGDIIGSPYEREPAYTKNFPLFRKRSCFTDDTVMTIAVAEALLSVGKDAEEDEIKNATVQLMRTWGNRTNNAGYGHAFRRWRKSENPQPYKSYGNGSAMRVSAVGWLYDDIYRTREVARWTAEVTHNHSEGIKGAESVAAAIYLARNGKSKAEIKDYVENEFSYDLSRTIEEIRPNYQFEVSCQKSVPESIIAFLESENFEEAIRNAIWLGGDADTQAAIAGSIAEAFYGIPDNLIAECRKRLHGDMIKVLDKFYEVIKDVSKVTIPNKLSDYFVDNVMFIHTSAGGAMGNAGEFEILDINGEFCQEDEYGHIDFKDLPKLGKRNKNGFTYFYMGCGHDLYVNDKVLEIFCDKHNINYFIIGGNLL